MTTFARLRRDPLKGKKEFSTHHGFTVIELLIAVAVLAIITSLALPSYRALIEKRQVTSGAQQVAAFLSSAKMEAVKRNHEVAIQCDNASCQTVQLARTEGEEDLELSRVEFLNVKYVQSITAGDDPEGNYEVILDPIRGMLSDADISALPFEMKLASSQDEDPLYALNVRVAASGRVIICSDHLERAQKAVPGYDACTNPGI